MTSAQPTSAAAIVFDLETGGLEPHHAITQIAAIAVDASWQEVETFERKVQFDVGKADPEALRLNSYEPEAWASEAIPEREAAEAFAAFCRKHATLELISRAGNPYTVARLAGHNVVAFDVPRVRAMMQRCGDVFWPACWWYPLDTYQGAIWHFHGREDAPENYRLPTLARAFGIDASNAHDALADTRIVVRLAAHLARRSS